MSVDLKKFAAARLAAAEAQPFLAEALYSLSPISIKGYGTFGVDVSWRLIVDPEVLKRWSVPEIAGVLLHEVGHLVRDHAGRAQAVGVTEDERELWNIAGDAEINQDLLRDGITLPSPNITPEVLGLPDAKVAEFYFKVLSDRRHVPEQDPRCGSGCHGVENAESSVERQTVSLSGVAGLNEGEQLLLRRRIALEVQRHQRTLGIDPGGWSLWAEALLEPVIDWRPLLRGAVRSAVAEVSGMVDYSYKRPSRRRVSGVVLPSMSQPVPTVAVVVDTSGSMSEDYLNAAWSEVQEAIRSVGIRRELVKVIMNDVEAEFVERPFGDKVELVGGGGTDLRVGMAKAMNLGPAPSILVVLTDGMTPWPAREPKARTVIGLISDCDDFEVEVPEWATKVDILVGLSS